MQDRARSTAVLASGSFPEDAWHEALHDTQFSKEQASGMLATTASCETLSVSAVQSSCFGFFESLQALEFIVKNEIF